MAGKPPNNHSMLRFGATCATVILIVIALPSLWDFSNFLTDEFLTRFDQALVDWVLRPSLFLAVLGCAFAGARVSLSSSVATAGFLLASKLIW